MESSDIDGGSSVAVLTYLRCILESITHPELVRLIFQYLLALPETQSEDMSITRPTTLARRRKSQTLLTTLAKGEEKPSPNLFNLVDLILTSLRSRNQQTVTATLRLCSTIIRSQHLHAVSTLIKVQANPFLITHRTIGAHNVEVETFLSIAEELAGGDDLELSYEAHLQDTLNLLETHCCSAKILALPGDDAKMKHKNTSSHGFPMSTSVSSHKILPDDPLLECLLSLLDTFLVNDIDTNLSLTQTFTNLASCGFTSLEDWLLRNHSNDDYPSEHEVSEDDYNEEDLLYDYQNASRIDGFAIMNASKQARLEPIRSPESSSPFLAALDSLVRQVEKFREQIQDFDIYLTERKHIFKVGEEIDSALADTPTPLTKSEDSKNTSTLTLQSPSHFSSISQRLLHETTSSNASRASSPRGRQNSGSAAPTLAGRLGRLRISSSPGPSKPIGRTYSASPFRNSSISSTPPKNATPMGPSDALHQKLKLSTGFAASRYHTNDTEGSETSSMHSEPVGPQGRKGEETREISLSHLLTNVIILQEFVLEVAALVEVRASLFGDVKFI